MEKQIKKSFISDPETASDLNLLYPKQNPDNSAKTHKPKSACT